MEEAPPPPLTPQLEQEFRIHGRARRLASRSYGWSPLSLFVSLARCFLSFFVSFLSVLSRVSRCEKAKHDTRKKKENKTETGNVSTLADFGTRCGTRFFAPRGFRLSRRALRTRCPARRTQQTGVAHARQIWVTRSLSERALEVSPVLLLNICMEAADPHDPATPAAPPLPSPCGTFRAARSLVHVSLIAVRTRDLGLAEKSVLIGAPQPRSASSRCRTQRSV